METKVNTGQQISKAAWPLYPSVCAVHIEKNKLLSIDSLHVNRILSTEESAHMLKNTGSTYHSLQCRRNKATIHRDVGTAYTRLVNRRDKTTVKDSIHKQHNLKKQM